MIEVTSIAVVALIFYALYKIKMNISDYEYYEKDKPVKVFMGKNTIYLRPDEFEAWESLPRSKKRQVANQYEKAIKNGDLYGVEQPDGTILYATKRREEWNQ
jgi:hypothetical protein